MILNQSSTFNSFINILQMVEVAPKKWTKTIKGNLSFQNLRCQLRGFLETDLASVDLKQYPNRPDSKINLSLGDPTLSAKFRTHLSNLEITAEVTKRQDLNTAYHIQGMQEARKKVSAIYAVKAFQITHEDVYITAGGIWVLFAVAKLLCNPGDNFLFPIPGYPYLLTMAQNNNIQIKPYSVKSDKNWEADISEMEALIDERTRFIVVNDPSNPLGSCWSNEYKKKIIQLCRKHKLPLLTDQIYQGITCDRSLHKFAEIAEDQEVPIFKCSGLAKQFCVPGWRVGWLIVYANKEVQKIVNKYLNRMLPFLPPTNMVGQASIVPLFNNPINKPSMETKIDLIQENIVTLNQTLRSLSAHFQQTKSSGGMFTAIRVSIDSFSSEIKDVFDLCLQLYAEENVVILPGKVFGSKQQFVRILTSTDHSNIVDFGERLIKFCRKYRQ